MITLLHSTCSFKNILTTNSRFAFNCSFNWSITLLHYVINQQIVIFLFNLFVSSCVICRAHMLYLSYIRSTRNGVCTVTYYWFFFFYVVQATWQVIMYSTCTRMSEQPNNADKSNCKLTMFSQTNLRHFQSALNQFNALSLLDYSDIIILLHKSCPPKWHATYQ